MKKLCVLSLVVMFCLSTFARENRTCSVVTSEGKMDCKKISLGFNKARIVLQNGEKMIIPINSINSYSIGQKVYNKLPLYQDDKPTGHKAFMELIKTYGELSLYKGRLCESGPYILKDESDFYFLYNGDRLHLALDEKTLPNICEHLGLKYSFK